MKLIRKITERVAEEIRLSTHAKSALRLETSADLLAILGGEASRG